MPITIQPLGGGAPAPSERSGPSGATHRVDRGRGVAVHGRSQPIREQPLRVLLVEDSELLVQRISELVAELPNVELAATAASEADAIAALQRDEIDAVILDLQLHVGSGFGVLRALNRRSSRPSVIVFTNFTTQIQRLIFWPRFIAFNRMRQDHFFHL